MNKEYWNRHYLRYQDLSITELERQLKIAKGYRDKNMCPLHNKHLNEWIWILKTVIAEKIGRK